MTKPCLIAVTLLICQLSQAQPPKTAREKAEQRLADLLSPAGIVTEPAAAPNPPPRKPSRVSDKPEAPLTSATVLPPAPPKPEAKPVRPRTLPEETPLVRIFNQPEAPQSVSLPAQSLIRLWSWNVN